MAAKTKRAESNSLTVEITQPELATALKMLAVTQTKGATIPILEYALIQVSLQDAFIYATSLDVWVKLPLRVVESRHEGSMTIPLKRATSLVGAVEQPVTITQTKSRVAVKSGRTSAAWPSHAGSDFPAMPAVEGVTVTLNSKALAAIIRPIANVTTAETSAYTLQSVQFQTEGNVLRVAATNGYRLAVARMPIVGDVPSAECAALVDKNAIAAIALVCATSETVTITFGINHIKVEASGMVVVTRLVAGKFPDISFIETFTRGYEASVKLNSFAVLNAINRVLAAAATKQSEAFITMQVDKQSLTVTMITDQGEAEDVVGIENGTPVTVGLNSVYAKAGLESADDVLLRFKDSKSAVEFYAKKEGPDEYEVKHIVMPARLDNERPNTGSAETADAAAE